MPITYPMPFVTCKICRCSQNDEHVITEFGTTCLYCAAKKEMYAMDGVEFDGLAWKNNKITIVE